MRLNLVKLHYIKTIFYIYPTQYIFFCKSLELKSTYWVDKLLRAKSVWTINNFLSKQQKQCKSRIDWIILSKSAKRFSVYLNEFILCIIQEMAHARLEIPVWRHTGVQFRLALFLLRVSYISINSKSLQWRQTKGYQHCLWRLMYNIFSLVYPNRH